MKESIALIYKVQTNAPGGAVNKETPEKVSQPEKEISFEGKISQRPEGFMDTDSDRLPNSWNKCEGIIRKCFLCCKN
jgi:hypothetical protein